MPMREAADRARARNDGGGQPPPPLRRHFPRRRGKETSPTSRPRSGFDESEPIKHERRRLVLRRMLHDCESGPVIGEACQAATHTGRSIAFSGTLSFGIGSPTLPACCSSAIVLIFWRRRDKSPHILSDVVIEIRNDFFQAVYKFLTAIKAHSEINRHFKLKSKVGRVERKRYPPFFRWRRVTPGQVRSNPLYDPGQSGSIAHPRLPSPPRFPYLRSP